MPIKITTRRKAVGTALTLGILLIAAAVTLNISWIILNWREFWMLLIGGIFFLVIIAGMILNTIFLVREIRRNEQHDSFINAVTHELKTPITSIRLYLETLKKRSVDEEKRKQFYDIMLDDTDRLLRTVEQVLKAGSLAQKREVQNFKPIEIEPILRDSMELVATRNHLAPELLHWQIEPIPNEHYTVLGDAEELRTAFLNILDNAVKYSREKVDIGVSLVAPTIDQVEVRVTDKGVGIPRGELKRIFKRFYRAANPGVKGTGIGLFIVRAIVKRHGGKVSAASEGAGKGTTVTLELPRIFTT
ncbi:periplasmic sensor signal transduction histidine kinase [Candidatus Koribacter versatilis Ellin345]|uniref:histidine kinase n=1 Tax=Koribacter versatilis (strain Ellin345) TaxID=204669 RepID=Q1IIY1_KORVE|nr:HAMP domain-containing sensor histidine kinase [Candidatus Koribacter versatilis]ABF43169.1 periplasmic sensor signal transduction histidine kinase [Candidatus Koribacter versatilis Ellin345]